MLNVVPLIQQIKPQYVTMLLNYYQNPTHYKKTQITMEKISIAGELVVKA